jgi:hypothetical protein
MQRLHEKNECEEIASRAKAIGRAGGWTGGGEKMEEVLRCFGGSMGGVSVRKDSKPRRDLELLDDLR